jgi:tetrahydromethanopterin S-methyltransferase subunit A
MNPTFTKVHAEIQRGMKLSRCRKCGCMKGTLENLKASLPLLKIKDASELLSNVNEWYSQLEPLEYPCFGCKYCIPPEAMTMLTAKYPALASATLSSCEMEVNNDSWPPVEGEYTLLDKSAPVAVTTLSSVNLEEKIVKLKPEGLCIVGKTETENIGIDKIVKNVISNPSISILVLAGKDTNGHKSGQTLICLLENGVDKDMRIKGSEGRRPILKNVSKEEVDKFRKQITIENMIGSENTRAIAKRVKELSQEAAVTAGGSGCGCSSSCCDTTSVSMPSVMTPKSTKTVSSVKAIKFSKSSIKLDKAGYFVILPQKKKANLLVEQYSNDNKLLRKIEGKNCRDIYLTIISNKWVTDLGHAAYLGKELSRAEASLKSGDKFVQDSA